MRFNRFGKSYQMAIDHGRDLPDVLLLDEALWGATSAPMPAFRGDPLFLQLLDGDKKSRITSADLKQAIQWFMAQLPDLEAITREFDGKLKLTAINQTTDEGKALLASANYILKELQAEDNSVITLTQIRSFLSTVQARALNGDGVLSLKAAGDNESIKALVTNVVAATGGSPDLDGTTGMSEDNLKNFLAAIPQYLEWQKKGESAEGETKSAIMPFGADTAACNALLLKHADRVEQFFQLSRLLQFDARLQGKALAPEAKVAAFDPANQEEVDAYLDSLPLAPPAPEAELPLEVQQINPVFRQWWQEMADKIIKPLLGDSVTSINQSHWQTIKAVFAPYEAYQTEKKGGIVESLPLETLRQYLDCEELLKEVNKLQVADKAVAETVRAAREVEKLLLYRTYLIRFANNFVNFSDLYGSHDHALFECGSLVIDGRWFHVCLQVDDIAGHQTLAKSSNLFIMYVEVQKSDSEKITVVVPVTSGSKGNLVVGKRGVFFDLQGEDFDAQILQIIENPVCIREALMAPFARLWGMVEGKIESWSGAAEKGLEQNFAKAITPGGEAAAPAAAAKPGESKMNSGAFLGISVAIAALGSALAFITKTLSSMSGLQIWITVLCAILALMFPITLMAIIKLSRQDLSSLLEGCGWAVNLRMRLDSKLRGQFTNFGRYPRDAQGTPRRHWLKVLIIILVLIIAIAGASVAVKQHRAAKAAEQELLENKAAEQANEKQDEAAAAEKAEAETAETAETAKTAEAETP